MTTFTERESQLMAFAWQCCDEQPKINYEKMALLAGMNNPRSCTNAWAAIKKKLAAVAEQAVGGADGADGDAPKIKPTPRKRGKKAADEDGEEGASPVKKAKPTPKKKGGKKAAAAAEEQKIEEYEGQEEAGFVKAEETGELI